MLLKKVFRNIFGLANDTVDSLSDAGREARQIVREHEQELEFAQNSLINLKSTYEVLLGQKKSADTEVAKWENLAQIAVNKNDDDLARECLNAQNTASIKAKAIDSQIAMIEPQVQALERQIDEIQAENDNMSMKADLIQVRSDVANASTKASEIIAGIGSGNSGADFAALEDKITKQEARAKVVAQQASKNNHSDLEKRVESLSTQNSVDEQLQALKNKMNS